MAACGPKDTNKPPLVGPTSESGIVFEDGQTYEEVISEPYTADTATYDETTGERIEIIESRRSIDITDAETAAYCKANPDNCETVIDWGATLGMWFGIPIALGLVSAGYRAIKDQN